MTAATDRRSITQHGLAAVPVAERANLAANTVVKKGWHIGKSSTGYSAPFTTATGLVSEGIAAADADTTGLADGAVTIETYGGVHELENSTSGDQLADGDAPCVCYAVDNQTVAKTSAGGTRSVAGVFLGISGESGKPRVGVGRSWAAIAAGVAADPGGAAALTSGSGTLVAGTATVANAAVTASSKILVTRKSKAASTALGEIEVPTRTANTSFVVNARKTSDGTTETGDISTFDYLIVG